MAGMPLLHKDRTDVVWQAQKKHITCIQDPVGVRLYTQTGTISKGGVELPKYRCARGSSSLESFHLHLNHFIPGDFLNLKLFFSFYLVCGTIIHRAFLHDCSFDALLEKVRIGNDRAMDTRTS